MRSLNAASLRNGLLGGSPGTPELEYVAAYDTLPCCIALTLAARVRLAAAASLPATAVCCYALAVLSYRPPDAPLAEENTLPRLRILPRGPDSIPSPFIGYILPRMGAASNHAKPILRDECETRASEARFVGRPMLYHEKDPSVHTVNATQHTILVSPSVAQVAPEVVFERVFAIVAAFPVRSTCSMLAHGRVAATVRQVRPTRALHWMACQCIGSIVGQMAIGGFRARPNRHSRQALYWFGCQCPTAGTGSCIHWHVRLLRVWFACS